MLQFHLLQLKLLQFTCCNYIDCHLLIAIMNVAIGVLLLGMLSFKWCNLFCYNFTYYNCFCCNWCCCNCVNAAGSLACRRVMRLAFQLAPGRCRRAIPGPTRAHRFFEIVILLLQLVPISATGWCLLAPSKHPSNLQSIQHPITHFWHCNTGAVSRTVLQHQLPTVKQPHTPQRPAMLAMVQ